MANREKKLSLGRKQASSSPVPPKESVTVTDSPGRSAQKTDPSASTEDGGNTTLVKSASVAKHLPSIGNRISKTAAKKAIRKTIAISLKAKSRRPIKIKQQLAKTLLNNAKNNLENKVLLKNGLKVKRIRRTKAQIAAAAKEKAEVKSETEDCDDGPPVLEPIYPVDENVDKKQPKKRTNKKIVDEENAKNKSENVKNYSSIDETIDSIISKARAECEDPKPKRLRKKQKSETEVAAETEVAGESIDEVIEDLTNLIKADDKEEAKPEVIDTSDKAKKFLNKKLVKKENIENTLDPSATKVIDMLDLNISNVKNKKAPIERRRHSIEKFPAGPVESADDTSFSPLFTNMPRSLSPRSKRTSKMRLSIDNLSRRSSPYTTRSDSPARILRNGKHRRLKDKNLLDGLDSEYKKRRRLCSDYSGSEKSVSKLSGYESDSSFSDLASPHAAEILDQKEELVKKDLTETTTAIIKSGFSSEANGTADIKEVERNFMDTNSNLCSDIKSLDVNKIKNENAEIVTDGFLEDTVKCEVKQEGENAADNIANSPSSKVPDKSIILDIMKQAFNDVPLDDQEKRPTRSSARRNQKLTEDKQEAVTKREQEQEIEQEDVNEEDEKTDTKAMNFEKPEESKDNSNNDVQKVRRKSESSSEKIENINEITETPENLAIKENILLALGLQSLKAAEAAKSKSKDKLSQRNDNYTGTLKTVIKIGRNDKKKGGRNSLKMTLQKSKIKNAAETDPLGTEEENSYKIMKESTSSSWKSHGAQSSDTAGAQRKSHYSNRSNMDGSSEHTSDGDTADGQTEGKALVIPEKASSFSIHPGRLCKDECSHCFGKFGLFDTPCHIAQMKSVERQDKILATEKHLTRDSCLCDACYRHVDRKSNTPSYTNKSSFKRSNLVAPGPRQNHCHVLGCSRVSTNILRRKWIIKMRKSVCQVINIDLDNPGLHSIPICDEHYTALEHLMVCAMCKRRLARNHIHYLGPESNDLNTALNNEGIPVTLTDKPVVCKLCKYFATLILKAPEERPENSSDFYTEYKRRLLHFHDVEIMDDAAAEEPIPVPTKDKMDKEQPLQQLKKKKKTMKNNEPPVLEPQVETDKSDQSRVPSESNSQSRSESPSDYMVDYNTLIPSIALECGSDVETSKRDTSKKPPVLSKLSKPESVKEAVEISKNLKLKSKTDDSAVQRLGSNPSLSVRQLFPGEEDLQLQASIEFNNVKERTPEGWEKCTSVIQYDLETKLLWQDLQKPYGNQSSFLRHLILLEKYFRCGDLILSPNASHHSRNYSESVHNRLRAYDNAPSMVGQMNLLSVGGIKPQKSSSGIITSKEHNFTILNAANIPKNTPITISQLNNPNFLNSNGSGQKAKNPGIPPGLISLHPGTTRPVAPLVKVPQKIKFPITKNWRPNLIPIDPNKKPEKRPGLVQVISSGKPYHITLEDYKKMCAIKRSFDLRQKKLQESQAAAATAANKASSVSNSLLKSIVPRKGLTISKTSTITSPKNDQSSPEAVDIENSLEKLESKFASDKSSMLLPKIPKSLTVIPQTVTRKLSRPSSPVLLITPKPKANISKS